MTYKMKDSGERSEFETGAVRDGSIGKGRYDLISPIALHRLATWSENGALKYEDRNWEKGIPVSRYIDSLIRHLMKIQCGLEDEDHCAAVLWNAQGLLHTIEAIKQGLLPKELDNRPMYFQDGQEEGIDYFENSGAINENS